MPEIIEFQEALEKGLIQKDHYFQTTAAQRSVVTVTEDETGWCKNQEFITEQGETKLWRLDEVGKIAEECKLLGPPTKEVLTLCGETGYKRGIDTLDKLAAGTNVFPEFFTDVHSCRLSERDYKVRNWLSFCKKMQNEPRRYQHKDDIHMRYFLASRCVNLDSFYVNFYLVCVNGGNVNYSDSLYNSGGGSYNDSYAVRPEAIPKRNLLLNIKKGNGTKESPWDCVPANEIAQSCASDQKKQSKAGLLKLIQEAQKETDIETVKKKLSQLEEYARNLD